MKRKELVKKCQLKLRELKKQYGNAFSTPQDIHNMSLYSRSQTILHEIDAALNRIKNGTYGICKVTGEHIEDKRLLAIPWTRVSLQALEQAS